MLTFGGGLTVTGLFLTSGPYPLIMNVTSTASSVMQLTSWKTEAKL